MSSNRRDFLRQSATAAGAVTVPYLWTSSYARSEEKNDKLNVASIGVGGRGSGIGRQAARLGNMVACCDVDKHRVERFAKDFDCQTYDDYRKVLDRKDVDVVTIGTPDHWHVKIGIEAMLAGKDVYCEKPLTLTIDEGKQISKVVKETKRVFQVGTQQRSENAQRFLKAVVIARSGRLGDNLYAMSSVDKAQQGGPFKEQAPPENLNWDMWLGPAPKTPYIKERTHYQFRWWLEYSGGQVTDWGVHHTDIAMWALGLENTGPTTIHGAGQFNRQPNCYNVARNFHSTMEFANGNKIVLFSGKNELLIAGDKGRIRVNRGSLSGAPVEAIKNSKAETDWLNEEVEKLYGGKVVPHMKNFFDCVKSRQQPISDVFTHHRSVSVCHLANIAMLLGRRLTWDPKSEEFVNDDQASAMLKREPRSGYEIQT